MPVYIAFHATGVAPICRHIASQAPSLLKAIDDAQISSLQLVSQPTIVQHPTPVDPAIDAWHHVHEIAEDFVNLGATPNYRSLVTREGVAQLVRGLNNLAVVLDSPAPVAPPPIQVAPAEPNVLVRWGSRWAGRADIEINTAVAVSDARNKKRSRQLLAGICPETWFDSGAVRTPCVVRPKVHFGGNKLFVCNSPADLQTAIRRCGPGWYASELIDKVREYRVFVLQGRVLSVSERFPGSSTDIAWNLHAGGRVAMVKRRDWPIDVVKTAIEAARRVGLDWTAVDLAVCRDGKVVVFETNTAPGVTTERGVERIAFAFSSLIESSTLPPLDLASISHWRDLLHPSLRND